MYGCPSGGVGLIVALAVIAALAAAACSTSAHDQQSGPAAAGGGKPSVQVVAAENFWGSIAAQVGGAPRQVTSIITNPNTDPHAYEPTAADGRTLADGPVSDRERCRLRPVGAQAAGGRTGPAARCSTSGTCSVSKDGDNPHRWYNPADVQTVIGAERRRLGRGSTRPTPPTSRPQQTRFETVALASRTTPDRPDQGHVLGHAGGSVRVDLRDAGSRARAEPGHAVLLPEAISEGTDVSAADKATIDNQITNHQIKIYVYNSQNTTPDVQAQLARVQGRPHPDRHHHRDAGARPPRPTRSGRRASCRGSWPPWRRPPAASPPADRTVGDANSRRRRPGIRPGHPATAESRAGERRPPWSRTPVAITDAAVRLGGRTIWSDVELDVARRRVRGRARTERGRASRH